MVIDKESYVLSESNYFKIETIKHQIVLGHTSSHNMNHILKWTNRLNGKYSKTAAFTIDINGKIYQHFDPSFFSSFLNNIEIDKKSIVILLENDGSLIKDTQNNQFINWIGHIYNKPEAVIEKRWRNHQYWAPYNEEQVVATIQLVRKLCKEFYIPIFAIPHNTKLNNVDEFEGVLYKSNLEKHYTDLSPAWDCERFKSELEKE
jgi:N-acetyl-anhydromuramyl-L-alanine amidase AmpD